LNDVRQYLREEFVEPTVKQIVKSMEDAQAPLRDCISAYAPDLLERMKSMMPDAKRFKKGYYANNRAIARSKKASEDACAVDQEERRDGDEERAESDDDDERVTGFHDSQTVMERGLNKLKGLLWSDRNPSANSQAQLVAMLKSIAPLVVQTHTINSVGKVSVLTSVTNEEELHFNVALQRQARAAMTLTALQIPMTIAKPVIEDLPNRALRTNMASFHKFVSAGCEASYERDAFSDFMGVPSESAKQPAVPTFDEVAETMKTRYGFEAPSAAILRARRALFERYTQIKEARAKLKSYRLMLSPSM